MAALCEICSAAPSKYKCPTCFIHYCSLACYKPHKANHEANKTVVGPSASDATATASVVEAHPSQPSVAAPKPQGYKSWPPDFYALPISPELTELVKSHPELKAQLRDIYLKTLEPADGLMRVRKPIATPAFRGRGRGRGGRGGAHHRRFEWKAVPWSREHADKDGLYLLGKMQGQETDGEGLRAFVDLVEEKYGAERGKV